MPTLVATPWPSGPVVVSTPVVIPYSGCPGVLLESCRKFSRSPRVSDGSSRTVSYLSACLTPARWISEYSSIEAWPMESTKRSRLGQTGSAGSYRRKSCQRVYATGAIATGVPGWPELAFWTASIDSVRMVLMQARSRSVAGIGGGSCGKS